MDYLQEVEKHIVRADGYLKNLLFKMSPLYRKEYGDNQDVAALMSCH